MADGNLKQALADLERFTPLFEGVLALAAAAREMDGIEQAVGEHRVILTGLKSELETVSAERDAAKEEAAKWRKDASEEVAAMRARAESDGLAFLEDAKATARQITDQAAEDVKTAQADAAAAREQEEAAKAATVTANEQLAELNSKIADAQAKIAQMLGQ